MILIGKLVSPFTRRVAITLEMLGLDYRVEPISVADQEALRRLNPVGRVPALVLDDGEILVDSLAIIDHLAQIAGPGQTVLPLAGRDRRRVLFANALVSGAIEKFVAAYYERTKRPEPLVYPPWIAACQEQARSALAHLEGLEAGPWLCGSLGPSLADITVATGFDFFEAVEPGFVNADDLPALHAIAAAVREMPSYRATAPQS